MTSSGKEDVYEQLHRRWEEIEHECRARGHQNRVGIWLNYCHVQHVTLCKECAELGQEEHRKLYAKLKAEGKV